MTDTRKKILLAEDDDAFATLVERSLGHDYLLSRAPNGLAAVKALESQLYDLAILDIQMPDMSGHDICNALSKTQNKNTPVLFLSGHQEIENKLLAFQAGARDYVTKPVHMLELRARVQNQINLAQPKDIEPGLKNQIDTDHLLLLPAQHKVVIKDSNDSHTFTKTEFKIFELLVRNDGAIVSRDRILNSVWGQEVNVSDRTIDAHIRKIRVKIGPWAHLIKAIHGVGYRFDSKAVAA